MMPDLPKRTIMFGRVGSTMIPGCVPVDDDYLVLVMYISESVNHAKELGYTTQMEDVYDDTLFVSMRKGRVNLIIVSDPNHYDRFMLALRLCIAARITDKPTRVMIHNAITSYKASK